MRSIQVWFPLSFSISLPIPIPIHFNPSRHCAEAEFNGRLAAREAPIWTLERIAQLVQTEARLYSFTLIWFKSNVQT